MLRAAGTRFTWHEFNAVHAFMRDEGPRYDAALASLGYALALEMFDRVLR
jgi:carboxymethylenebutenolidase